MLESQTMEAVPLAASDDGVIRISGTRVTLDTVVSAFLDGSTPEETIQQYPALSLADVYQVIAYYLRHTQEVDSYLERRRIQSEEVRTENERRWPAAGIRQRLLARRRGE